jgi:hypothetical protein
VRAEIRITYPCRVLQHCLEYELQLPGRSGDDAQYFRCRRLLLQRFGKVLPRLVKLTGARFELLFQLDQCGLVANVRSRLRSGRTKLAAACWALCAFERQGHLVGTATDPLPVGPAKDRAYQS